jgi:TonB family protein
MVILRAAIARPPGDSSLFSSAFSLAAAASRVIAGRIDSDMNSAPLGSDYAGRVIDGKFTLLRLLGGTERSSVFLTELGDEPRRKAAIKFIPADRVNPEACLAQWQAAATLSHPHLIAILDRGRCQLDGQDLLYVVTEYAEEVLSEILPERPLTPAETSQMLGPVLDALAFLHQRNLVHGHLKPSNILVVDDCIKLSADRLQAAGELAVGPPSPIDAPEVGTEKLAPAADIWSLGFLILQALTQQLPPWERAQGGEPELPASIPQPFLSIARECLRVDPAWRCTLAAVRAHLEPAQPAQPVAGSVGKPFSKTAVFAVVGAVLGVALVLAVLTTSSHRSAPSPAAPSQSSSPAPSQSPAPAAETPSGPVVKGEIAHQALPDVPEEIEATIRGHIKVDIRVQVDPDGKVVQAAIDYAGPSHYFADRALDAAKKWKFSPAWVGGRTAPSVWVLHFLFASTQTDVNAQEVSP